MSKALPAGTMVRELGVDLFEIGVDGAGVDEIGLDIVGLAAIGTIDSCSAGSDLPNHFRTSLS